jgi:hypothetical protein
MHSEIPAEGRNAVPDPCSCCLCFEKLLGETTRNSQLSARPLQKHYDPFIMIRTEIMNSHRVEHTTGEN